MKTKQLCLLLLLPALLLPGCSPVYYMPTLHNVPLFREKGEFSATATNTSTEYSGNVFETQLAYAVLPNWYTTTGGTVVLEEAQHNSAYLAEGGFGYFRTLNPKKNLVFETLGCVGFGKVYARAEPRFLRLYVQPAIGFRSSFFESAVSCRFASLRSTLAPEYRPVSHSGPEIYLNYDFGIDHGMYYFLEPAWTVRAGYKGIKLHTQMAWVQQLNNRMLSYNNLSISLGLTCGLPFRKR